MNENKKEKTIKFLRKYYEMYICNRENTVPLNSKLSEAMQMSMEQTAEFEEMLDDETLAAFDRLCDVNIEERDESEFEVYLNGVLLGYYLGYCSAKSNEK